MGADLAAAKAAIKDGYKTCLIGHYLAVDKNFCKACSGSNELKSGPGETFTALETANFKHCVGNDHLRELYCNEGYGATNLHYY